MVQAIINTVVTFIVSTVLGYSISRIKVYKEKLKKKTENAFNEEVKRETCVSQEHKSSFKRACLLLLAIAVTIASIVCIGVCFSDGGVMTTGKAIAGIIGFSLVVPVCWLWYWIKDNYNDF